MPHIGPWSNFHELNLDWILEQLKALQKAVDDISGSSTPYDSNPEMDGTATPGDAASYARGNHVHPTDTSRAAAADLSQEILDRGNADITLAADISAVDDKIKFSSAAPIMDSSSASAGFSDFLARADHIHPTDTSRASATDLAVLEARVDGFTGSALPSDLTPNMDGVGSAGSGGNYSRGDHVHPSDTSKLDVAGGTVTGSLTVQGVLTPEKQQAFVASTFIGWIRVATIPRVEGTKVTIQVVRKGTLAPAEMHTVNLSILQNTITFRNEVSDGDVLYVDKIRYTDAGALDIHMDQVDASDIAVYITPYAPTKAAQDAITTITPTGVAEAPIGETILAGPYSFHEETGFLKTYVDPTTASYTIGANHYTTVTYPTGLNPLDVVAIGIYTFSTVSGPITIVPYGQTENDTVWYLLGEAGATITNVKFRYWYI